jgi:hypothetical protein
MPDTLTVKAKCQLRTGERGLNSTTLIAATIPLAE